MNKTRWIIVGIILAAIAALTLWQAITLRKAHSTFDNYYAFRGCASLVSKTDTSGICALPDGQQISIVEFQNKWYLAGDLPRCIFGVCL